MGYNAFQDIEQKQGHMSIPQVLLSLTIVCISLDSTNSWEKVELSSPATGQVTYAIGCGISGAATYNFITRALRCQVYSPMNHREEKGLKATKKCRVDC